MAEIKVNDKAYPLDYRKLEIEGCYYLRRGSDNCTKTGWHYKGDWIAYNAIQAIEYLQALGV